MQQAGLSLTNDCVNNVVLCTFWWRKTYRSHPAAPGGKSRCYQCEKRAPTGRRTYIARRLPRCHSSSISACEQRRCAGVLSGCIQQCQSSHNIPTVPLSQHVHRCSVRLHTTVSIIPHTTSPQLCHASVVSHETWHSCQFHKNQIVLLFKKPQQAS